MYMYVLARDIDMQQKVHKIFLAMDPSRYDRQYDYYWYRLRNRQQCTGIIRLLVPCTKISQEKVVVPRHPDKAVVHVKEPFA